MSVSVHVLALLAVIAVLAYRLLINPSCLSPLSQLPVAHWSCHILPTWFNRKCTTDGELKTLHAIHQRHGPIVRLGPHEVSVVSEEGLKKIYNSALDKSDWYARTFRLYNTPNLVCTLDHHTHSTIRRMVAGLYTKSHLQHCAELDRLSNRIVLDKLLPKLSGCGQGAREVEVMKLFECVGVDFISNYIFGNDVGTDFLDDQNGRDNYLGEWARIRDTPGLTKKPLTESLFMGMCGVAIADRQHNTVSKDGQPTVAAKMYQDFSGKAQQWEMTDHDVVARIASEMVDMVIATQETNTITWAYIMYRLSQRPELQSRLRAELHTLEPQIDHSRAGGALPSSASIDSLPLLDAVVFETLRLHAANPARMRRVVPPAGLDLHSYFIPHGTTISTNAYCLHRNEDVFPEPFDWLPERWLSGDERGEGADDSQRHTMRKWFFAFGSGPRGCIGQHFALQSKSSLV